MIRIHDIIRALEELAPPSYQESYDNAGLITGDANAEFKASLHCLDSTEAVIDEAIAKGANLVVAHHPIIFKGLKGLTGRSYIERVIIKAIKHDIAIYAIHTNLDNVRGGVNEHIADKLGLKQEGRSILIPKKGMLQKVECYVPESHLESLKEALWQAGAGHLGHYDQCSFSLAGQGTYRPLEGAQPFEGTVGQRSTEAEVKIEFVFPKQRSKAILSAMQRVHPYETVAYQVIELQNSYEEVGSGMVGELAEAMPIKAFLEQVKSTMKAGAVKHTALCHEMVNRVAVMGGSGIFGLGAAKGSGAQVYITSDVKYHEFFDADGDIILVDIGHYESEQYTPELLRAFLEEKFPKFAHLLTGVSTNPVNYL